MATWTNNENRIEARKYVVGHCVNADKCVHLCGQTATRGHVKTGNKNDLGRPQIRFHIYAEFGWQEQC